MDQMVSVIKAGKAGRSARDDVFDFLAVHALLARGPNAELKKAAKKNKALLGLERTSNSR